MTTREQLIDRLIADNPAFYVYSEEEHRTCNEALLAVGIAIAPGVLNMSVPGEILRHFQKVVQPDHCTLETGAGQTTVALAALGRHHTCVTLDVKHVELIKAYMSRVGIPPHKVTFLIGSSDKILASMQLPHRLDFAYVDGCHGYPFPALDWHLADAHMKIGGVVGFDNTEIAAVADHCRFLDQDQSYALTDVFCFSEMYGVNFYRKVRDEHREWVFQATNQRRAPYYRRFEVPPATLRIHDGKKTEADRRKEAFASLRNSALPRADRARALLQIVAGGRVHEDDVRRWVQRTARLARWGGARVRRVASRLGN